MLNCKICLPGVEPDPAAPPPTVSKTRVELQGAVHQPDRCFDVLAKVTQHVASMGKYARIVARDVKGLPSEVDRLTPVCIPRVCRAAYIKLKVAPRGKGERGAIAWIALDRPPEQVDGLDDAVLFVREAVWERAQIDHRRRDRASGDRPIG